jgi:membrane protein DedA with SNARE-associated domain
VTTVLASLIDVNHLVEVSGYPILFVLVMAESGGVPVPGETALIVGSVLASQGKMHIELVIAVAALAAIVGDNIGYQIGRKGGRWLLERPGRLHRQRLAVLAMGEPFFERHGPKAVFFGRFILGMRTWASWLAGANHMRWRTFFLWNALGGICWATGVGLIAYLVGRSADNAITTFGIYGLVAVVVALGGGFLLHMRHRRRQRVEEEAEVMMHHRGAGEESKPAGTPRRVEGGTPVDGQRTVDEPAARSAGGERGA